LLFRSEEAIRSWCRPNHLARGEVLTLGQTWDLAKQWYHNRMAPDYRGRSIEQVSAIFRQLGLTAPFWDMPAHQGVTMLVSTSAVESDRKAPKG
jgi:hypothetical protein